MGQTWQELPGRAGGVTGVRCTCCGQRLAGEAPVTAVLREVVYEYCDDGCRDRHAEIVALGSVCCELCDLDAVGDTGRCAVHVDDDAVAGVGSYPLAS